MLDAQNDTLNVMRYNLLNLPEQYVTAVGDTVNYVKVIAYDDTYDDKPFYTLNCV